MGISSVAHHPFNPTGRPTRKKRKYWLQFKGYFTIARWRNEADFIQDEDRPLPSLMQGEPNDGVSSHSTRTMPTPGFGQFDSINFNQ